MTSPSTPAIRSSSPTSPASASPTPTPAGQNPGIPFGRLVMVETRKFFDTRVGQVLTAITIVFTIAIMAAYAYFGDAGLQGTITISGAVLSIMLPAMGILAVTAEWSHNTATTTFSLEPRRIRVVVAKLFPPVITTVATCAIIVAVAFPVTALAASLTGTPANWNLDAAAVAGWCLVNVIMVLSGVALGTLLLNAPAAILVVVGGTVVWSLIAATSEAGATISSWANLSQTTAPLVDATATFDDLARIAVSIAVWVVLPFVLGAVRIVRRELR